MADIRFSVLNGVTKRLRDMGVGTDGSQWWAEEVYAVTCGSGVVASANFMPAAAAYSAGDIIDVAKEMVWTDREGLAVPSGSLIRVLSSIVKMGETAILSGETSYRLQAYGATPPSGQADNDAWALAAGDLSAYRGAIELGTPVDLGAACYVKSQCVDPVTGLPGIDIKLSGTSIFGELVTVGGATLTAVVRQVFLYGIVL
jgi:hypothetical protein